MILGFALWLGIGFLSAVTTLILFNWMEEKEIGTVTLSQVFWRFVMMLSGPIWAVIFLIGTISFFVQETDIMDREFVLFGTRKAQKTEVVEEAGE